MNQEPQVPLSIPLEVYTVENESILHADSLFKLHHCKHSTVMNV